MGKWAKFAELGQTPPRMLCIIYMHSGSGPPTGSMVMLVETMAILGYMALGADAAAPDKEPVMVDLLGSPSSIGETWGRVNGEAIRGDMEKTFLEPARKRGLTEADLVGRGRRFVEICSEIAPHWLDEIEATANAARVDPALYTAYAGSVYRNLFLGGECTSYAIAPSLAEDGAILFHKNRDNVDKAQSLCLVASGVPGVNRFITVTDAAVLSCMMMVNEKGLAGSADTGGLKPVTPGFRGMMNTYILRHIAERAGSCAEALAIVKEFVEKGWYAGGGLTGTHWLFVDRDGTVLEIANNGEQVESRIHENSVYFSAREESGAANTLKQAALPIGFHTFHNVSRDPSMCIEASISGLTVEISQDHPEALTCAWATLPAKGLAFPLLMGGTATPLPLVNGEVYALSKGLDGKAAAWETIEENAHANRVLLDARVKTLLTYRKRKKAAALMDDWTRRTCAAQVAVLKLMAQ